jgi:predicted ATPase
MRPDLPTGTVTLLFTDVEGSTKLLHELGPQAYADALLEHRRLLRDAFSRHGGVEVDTEGDAFFVAFAEAAEAVAAAVDAQAALASGPIKVRMGLHTGTPHVTSQGYVGVDVHLGARIAAVGHGGQVLLSKATAAAVASQAELADLGEHRLKDFAEPVWIYQLGSDRFPPLKSISNTNLPRPASAFVGREREVSEVTALLRDGARLVTLTGPGGMGKTRLSLEAASELVPDFRNGTFWVNLAPLTDPALVPATIAATIGAKDELVEHIGQRELLLVLDNLEQVIEAGAEVARLVSACPNLRVLATSRERLRVRGETEYAVPPLASHEAVELFVDRSGLEPDETIATLCRRLDNLPLALELAAARTSVLSPAQILERLAKRLDLLKGGRDAEVRQATLRATIEWSHDLLNDEEKRLFARLAVFAGGWTLEAAESVAEADLDVLESLVDKSLVRHDGERFVMLETIRQYASEQLEANGEADKLRQRHAEFFLAFAEEAEPHLRLYSAEWLEHLERDHDNLRAALAYFSGPGFASSLIRLTGSLTDLWVYGGHVDEGWRYVTSALAADTSVTLARARALAGAADLAQTRGDIANGNAMANEALSMYRQLGNDWGAAYALAQLGMNAIEESDYETAKARITDSIALYDQLGEDEWVIANTRSLAWAHDASGDHATARALHEANLARARAAGVQETVVGTLGSLTMIAAAEGREADAIGLARENLLAAVELGSAHPIAQSLCRIADLCVRFLGRPEAAAQLLGCFDGLREQIGVSESWVARKNEETSANVARQLHGTTIERARLRGQAMTIEQGVAFALEQLRSDQ